MMAPAAGRGDACPSPPEAGADFFFEDAAVGAAVVVVDIMVA